MLVFSSRKTNICHGWGGVLQLTLNPGSLLARLQIDAVSTGRSSPLTLAKRGFILLHRCSGEDGPAPGPDTSRGCQMQ